MQTMPVAHFPEDLIEIWKNSEWRFEGEELPKELKAICTHIALWVNNNLINNTSQSRLENAVLQPESRHGRKQKLLISVPKYPFRDWKTVEDFRSMEYFQVLMQRKLPIREPFIKQVNETVFEVNPDGTLMIWPAQPLGVSSISVFDLIEKIAGSKWALRSFKKPEFDEVSIEFFGQNGGDNLIVRVSFDSPELRDEFLLAIRKLPSDFVLS